MGDSPSQSTVSSPQLDPEIKARLLQNLDTADMLTSGILPHAGPSVGTGSGSASPSGLPSSYGTSGAGRSSDYGTYGGSTISTPFGDTSIPGGPAVNPDGTPYKPPTTLTAGFTPDQLTAFQQIRNLPNAGLTSPEALGRNTFDQLANFNAPDISATSVTAPTMRSGQVGQVGDISSKNFTDYDLSKYMNPAISQVVDPVKQYFDTQSDRAASAAQGQARAAGALRGSNPAIATALARGEVANQAGMALSPLYQNAYDTATGLVSGDANRDLTASQGNQSTQLTRATTQANLDQGANAANQEAALRAGLANQDAALRAGIANQGASVSSANIRNTGALNYGAANKAASDQLIQNASLLGSIGDQQQAQDQAKIDDPFKALAIRSGMVQGALPGTTGSTSTTTGGGAGIGGTLGGLGTAALGLSKLIPLL